MGEIINKISFNGTAYDITIPHGTVSALQSGTNYNIVRVSSLPSIGQMIAITFPARLTTPMVIFETEEIESMVSTPMTITYKGRGISPDTVVPYSTYSFIITQDTSSNLMLELIGDFDSVLGAHASSSTSYGVGTIGNYGHVKISNDDVNTVSHSDGLVAGMDHTHGNYAPTSHASSSTTYGVGTTSNYGHVKISNGDVNTVAHSNGLVAGMNHTHGNYAPTSHASSSTTYGVGTTSNYGHVKISNGDVNTVAHSDGLVAGMDHTHGNYAHSSHTSSLCDISGTYYGHCKQFNDDLSSITRLTVQFNGVVPGVQHTHGTLNFGTCSTAATTTVKAVTITGIVLKEGTHITVAFSNKNSATNPQLNINGTTGASIKFLNSSTGWCSGWVGDFVLHNGYWYALTPVVTSSYVGGNVQYTES